ncbi:MAG: pentapeptide repeat-containing protein [Gammaproteobacteria bacterium]
MPGFLLIVALGLPLLLVLLADGEWWEEELLGGHVVISEIYLPFRRLDLSEQVLLAKPAKPEIVAQLRDGDPEKVKEALKQVERINLRKRGLRGAQFSQALMLGADLRDAQLQGANLSNARLQGVILEKANLNGADLAGANVQGANLDRAQLQGARLMGAELQGANLAGAALRGAMLQDARLPGTDLTCANLQGAKLIGAALNGADLREAQLQVADFGKARLQGGDLRYANLYGAYLGQSSTGLIDLQAARWTPLEKERLAEMRMLLVETITDTLLRKQVLDRIERGGKAGLPPPILNSCLIDPDVTPELTCKEKWLPDQIDAFRSELFPCWNSSPASHPRSRAA